MPVCRLVGLSPEGLLYRKRTDPVGDASAKLLKWRTIREIILFGRPFIEGSVDEGSSFPCLQILAAGQKEPLEFDEHDPKWQALIGRLPKLLPGCQAQNE